MRLDSIADVRMVGRALMSGWLDNCEQRKNQAVHDLSTLWRIRQTMK